MPYATTTLPSTTFSTQAAHSEPQIGISSLTGIVPGLFLYADRELMRIMTIGVKSGINNFITVQRGVAGTVSHMHVAGQKCYIGRGDQFYTFDPKGAPPQEVIVSPHINVNTGDIWVVLGDDGGPQSANRWWSKLNVYNTVGSLGVRNEVVGTIQPTGAGAISVVQD